MKFNGSAFAMAVAATTVGVLIAGLVMYHGRDIELIKQAGDGFDY